MSALGNDSPTSISSMRPSSSTTAMLRPTSPTPPRKMTRAGPIGEDLLDAAGYAAAERRWGRNPSQRRGRLHQASVDERPAHPLALVVGRRDERQSRGSGG